MENNYNFVLQIALDIISDFNVYDKLLIVTYRMTFRMLYCKSALKLETKIYSVTLPVGSMKASVFLNNR